METRSTLKPGDRGTRKLVARFGKRLVCVRYRYDPAAGVRYTTVELVVRRGVGAGDYGSSGGDASGKHLDL